MCRSLKMAVQVPEAPVELPQPMLWCCADVRTEIDVRKPGLLKIDYDARRSAGVMYAQRAMEALSLKTSSPHCVR